MNSINDFGPFNVEIWGTVGDWVMITVTGATGILLWLTFKSQLKIIRFEEYQHRIRLMPVFSVELNKSSSIHLEAKKLVIYVTVDIRLQNINNAKQVEIVMPNNKDWSYITKPSFTIDLITPKQNFQVIFMAKKEHIMVNGEDYTHAFLSFDIKYMDEIGHPYNQTINYLYAGANHKVGITSPTVLKK